VSADQPKTKRTKRGEIYEYLREKAESTKTEMEIRRETLALEREKLEFEKQKYMLEEKERENRLKLENAERSVMIQIIKNKLL
jgi:uncharacterized protein involved in exopolysaccharide biosynthesis